jgi:hypothetical protein
MKGRYNDGGELLPVAIPRVGVLYHVSWASRGVVGKCMSIDENNKTVILRRPKSKTNFANPVKWSDLRHTRRNQSKPH